MNLHKLFVNCYNIFSGTLQYITEGFTLSSLNIIRERWNFNNLSTILLSSCFSVDEVIFIVKCVLCMGK